MQLLKLDWNPITGIDIVGNSTTSTNGTFTIKYSMLVNTNYLFQFQPSLILRLN